MYFLAFRRLTYFYQVPPKRTMLGGVEVDMKVSSASFGFESLQGSEKEAEVCLNSLPLAFMSVTARHL
ncbi:hypothetical protein AXF15_00465 [Desulfomicrobium orale DSM 12838]|uniref:Uncharacterized protein n=1 Tax=Desulfomicrobium orale DSM 12838 TaxID=888061 RepID=A0A0X8JMZ5_9BACT|nr:hypothetical protein AXF15_00465 [Desulfomicrobium orale DSM 12838]